MADAQHCPYLGNPPLQQRTVTAGIHGLSNATLDTPWPKSEVLRDALHDWLWHGVDDDFTPLWAALENTAPAADALLPDTGIGQAMEQQLSAGFVHERRFGPGGTPQSQSRWHFDGHGHFTQK